MRARERAFLKSESSLSIRVPGIAGQFTFTKGPCTPRGALMDETSQNFFSRAAFAQNQNGNVQARGAFDRCRTACIASDGPK